MANITNAYQNVISAYNTFSSFQKNDPRFRVAQKTLFAALDALYLAFELPPVEALSREVYYYQAQLVQEKKTFQYWPNSFKLLAPKANNYCKIVNEILSSLKSSSNDLKGLQSKLKLLGESHSEFVQIFIPEMKKVAPQFFSSSSATAKVVNQPVIVKTEVELSVVGRR